MTDDRHPTAAEADQIYDLGNHLSYEALNGINKKIGERQEPRLRTGTLLFALAKTRSVIEAWEQVLERTEPDHYQMYQQILSVCRKNDDEKVKEGFKTGVFKFSTEGE